MTENIRLAFQGIWGHKLRSLLTMLGIIIGILAVIVIVGLGNGMTASMKDSFSSMGTNTLTVNIMGYGSRMVSIEDVYNIVEENPDLFEDISPVVIAFGVSVGIGILFGYLPAKRAARLNPIEALRYD